jgi:hypothetical protein
MPEPTTRPEDEIQIDLRDPRVAAVWAWLWPGAGHIYQRRHAKGILYMVCILGTWFFGLSMGQGHVVYAQFSQDDKRWHYLLQLGVGIPALPAIVQTARVRQGKDTFTEWMAPPGKVTPNQYDTLAKWHGENNALFELGTLYTVVAGLLNVLVIYDAYAGPVIAQPEDEKTKRGPPKKEPAS